MEADEAGSESDPGSVIEDLWRVLLDCDKSGKDALKSKIKEHTKKKRAKEKKRHRKEKKRDKKSKKSKTHGAPHQIPPRAVVTIAKVTQGHPLPMILARPPGGLRRAAKVPPGRCGQPAGVQVDRWQAALQE